MCSCLPPRIRRDGASREPFDCPSFFSPIHSPARLFTDVPFIQLFVNFSFRSGRLVAAFALVILAETRLLAQAPGRLVNLSSLLHVPVAGVTTYFRIEGSTPKQVLVRGVGPTLGSPPFNVAGTMSDPQLSLFNASGAPIATNDDWGGAAALQTAFGNVGAFELSSSTSKDAALLVTLAPGSYSVRLSGVGATTGAAIIEIYAVPGDAAATAYISYLALSSPVTPYTTGFVLSGSSPTSIVARALGPALPTAGALANPQLTLFSGGLVVAANDNWGGTAALAAAFAHVGALQLAAGSLDSALSITLNPGSHNVQVSGVGGATGITLVEIFDATTPAPSRPPFVMMPPQSLTVTAGQPANLSVLAGGTSPLGYQWRRNGMPIVGATGATLAFNTTLADAGNFDVVVTNDA